MKIFDAKKKLATIWFIYGGILFILILVQSLLGKYEDKVNEAWSWFFPNVIPTLSLMISIFLFDVRKKKSNKTVDVFYYRIPLWLSVIYLSAILLTILVQPFTSYSIIKSMSVSNFYLGPFQGLITASIGFLFVKAEE